MKVRDIMPITVIEPGTVWIVDTYINTNNLVDWAVNIRSISIRLTFSTGEIKVFYFGSPSELKVEWDRLGEALVQAEHYCD